MEQLADYVIQFNNCPADNPRHIAQQIVETIRDGCQIEVEVHFYAKRRECIARAHHRRRAG